MILLQPAGARCCANRAPLDGVLEEPETFLVTLGVKEDPVLEYENTKGLEDPLGG